MIRRVAFRKAITAGVIGARWITTNDWPLSAQGLATVSQLVTQEDSPLYYEHAERSLRDTLRSALLALPAGK